MALIHFFLEHLLIYKDLEEQCIRLLTGYYLEKLTEKERGLNYFYHGFIRQYYVYKLKGI